MSMDKDVLTHFGIPGMHWGQRKGGGGGRILSGTRGHMDHEQARQLQKKGTKNLSTAELATLTKRLQLERQLKDLGPKSAHQRRMDTLKSITSSGKTVSDMYNLAKSPLGLEIAKQLGKLGTKAAKKAP
jgi:hypothetical protein